MVITNSGKRPSLKLNYKTVSKKKKGNLVVTKPKPNILNIYNGVGLRGVEKCSKYSRKNVNQFLDLNKMILAYLYKENEWHEKELFVCI